MQAAQRGYARAVLISDTVLPVYSGDCASRLLRAVASTDVGPAGPYGLGIELWRRVLHFESPESSRRSISP